MWAKSGTIKAKSQWNLASENIPEDEERLRRKTVCLSGGFAAFSPPRRLTNSAANTPGTEKKTQVSSPLWKSSVEISSKQAKQGTAQESNSSNGAGAAHHDVSGNFRRTRSNSGTRNANASWRHSWSPVLRLSVASSRSTSRSPSVDRSTCNLDAIQEEKSWFPLLKLQELRLAERMEAMSPQLSQSLTKL